MLEQWSKEQGGKKKSCLVATVECKGQVGISQISRRTRIFETFLGQLSVN
jgi:hypothetical protein